jgi:hypothetical protein
VNTETIVIRVNPEVARAYRAASEEDRCKLDLLVGLQLAEFLKSSESLATVMDAMSQEAANAGLTPEMSDSILHRS